MTIPGETEERIYALLEAGQVGQALELTQQLTRQHPGDPDAWFARAGALGGAERFAEAEQALREAVTINPRHAVSWFGIGELHRRQGHWADALPCYDRALAIEPAVATTWLSKAEVLSQLGRSQDAAAACRKAAAYADDDEDRAASHDLAGRLGIDLARPLPFSVAGRSLVDPIRLRWGGLGCLVLGVGMIASGGSAASTGGIVLTALALLTWALTGLGHRDWSRLPAWTKAIAFATALVGVPFMLLFFLVARLVTGVIAIAVR